MRRKKEKGIAFNHPHTREKPGQKAYTRKECYRVVDAVKVPIEAEKSTRGKGRPLNPDGRISVYVGFQVWELVDLCMKAWDTNVTETVRRLLLPLCGPFKRTIRGKGKNVVVHHEYTLDPEAYEKRTWR